MNIVINGEKVNIQGHTLSDLMAELDAYETKSAVALNGDFIPKQKHQETVISEGDYIEILSPMQGG